MTDPAEPFHPLYYVCLHMPVLMRARVGGVLVCRGQRTA